SLGVGAFVTWSVVVAGLGFTGALALGVMYALVGLVYGGAAAVTAQVTQSARAANGLAVAFLGASYALRALGDAGPHWVADLSPLGWAQAMRPFAAERWWLIVPLLALAGALVLAATWLLARRDLGAGLLPQGAGPARGTLRHA